VVRYSRFGGARIYGFASAETCKGSAGASPYRSNCRIIVKFFTLIFYIALCASTYAQAQLQRFEFSETQMGLPFRIVLYAKDSAAARRASDAAFARVKQLNDILSDYDSDSELSLLSRTSGSGKAVRVSDDLWNVLARAQFFAEKSGGAFDVTVGPVVNLWRYARQVKRLPDPVKLERARKAVGYKNVRLNRNAHTVELLVPNMRLDVGGIGKGYALDAALKVLKTNGVDRALVSGGGDMAVGDAPPDKKGWKIELAEVETNAPKEFVFIKNCGLATSGDMFQRLEINGKRYSHIVDPRTGIGLTDHSLVTVIGPNAMTADATSKPISVLGPKAGMKFARSIGGVEVRVLREPGEKVERVISAGFRVWGEGAPSRLFLAPRSR
jgi:thiamine biosynthesis lipoprotein